jgi:hypothetical protein
MNVTWNPDTEQVEWAPYRGDYGVHYAGELIEGIEELNCVKGCLKAGTQAQRDEFGPGGNCDVLAIVSIGEYGQTIPELDPRPDGPHCTARQDPATAGAAPLFEVGP